MDQDRAVKGVKASFRNSTLARVSHGNRRDEQRRLTLVLCSLGRERI
jgi:hypothetical protein